MPKKLILTILLAFATALVASAQWDFVNAKDLTIVGKLFPDTANPWHRIDTDLYSGFDATEFKQVHMSAGIAVAFRTDSPSIAVKPTGATVYGAGSSNHISQKGFDLYIRRQGRWLWAGQTSIDGDKVRPLIFHNDSGMSECLVYLPLFSELSELEIGIQSGCRIEAVENPFKYRIAVFGSSFTHGSGTTRPGMCWPSQFSRMTGLQLLNLGCAGHSLLQPYFAEALADAPDIDAYIFDGFSNPTADVIAERLFPFIEIIRERKPDTPIIFLKTLYREWRNFNSDVDRKESDKQEMVDYMMKKACKKYKNVHYVDATNAADELHDTTVDGTHPGNWGYRLYVESIKDEVLKILKTYGIGK